MFGFVLFYFSIKKAPPPSGSGLKRGSDKVGFGVKSKVVASGTVETSTDLVGMVMAVGGPPIVATGRL